jgi:hypothetical protein
MNSINNRLLEMKLRLEVNCSDTAVVSAVWTAIENLDFGGLDAASLENYFRCLDATDQMEWIKYGGSQLTPESQRDILARQEACFKLELVKRMDCEDLEIEQAVHTTVSGSGAEYHWQETVKEIVEIDGQFFEDEKVVDRVSTTAQMGGNVVTERRVKSAFDVAMTEKFGSDWDVQLQNPRGSQSSGTLKVLTDCLNEKGEQMVMSSSRQYGRTVISLKPVSVAKHPSVEIEFEERGTIFKREVLVHEPLENSIECGIMLKEEFESLKVVSIPMSGSNGDIAGGHGSREVFMVGLVPYVRHRQCRCADGWINVAGNAVHLTAWNSKQSELAAYCSEASDWSVMEAWLADCPNPLESYYSWKFPNKDASKLAINAMAGVHSSRLTKAGLAPKIYVPHLDAMRRQQNCERFIQWNVDDQIRKLLGGTKLKSDVRTIKNVDPNMATHRVVDANGKPILVPVLDAAGNPVKVANDKIKLSFVEEVSAGFTDTEELDVSDWYDEIHEESGLTYLEAARKNLAKSWVQSSKNANRELARNAEKTIGKMYKSKSSKLRNGDKSCTVNGARSNVLTESTLWLKITCAPERVVAGFENEFADGEFIGELCGNGRTKIVDASKMEKLFTALGFDFVEFSAEEMLRGKEITAARKESVAGLRKIDEAEIDEEEIDAFEAEVAPIVDQMRGVLEGDRGFAKGGTGLTKDDRDRMLKSYMIRLNDLSIESVYMDGDSPWLNIREHLFPEDVTVLCRCVNMDELGRLQKARQLVADCGMDVSDIKQILSAYRKPVLFRKMFFDGEVRSQVWAGLR